MGTDQLVVTDRGRVRWLRLNRPEKRNAMTAAMADELRSQLEATAADADIGALVVCAAGTAFSSGVDRKEAFEGPDATLRQRRDRPLWPVEELVTHPKPVLCALNGAAHGGGATLALACDLRIAAESATLTFNLARVGLSPEFGSSFLLWRHVGYGRALDLMLTGRTVDAGEALAIGLVNRVVPDADLDACVEEAAAAIAALPVGAATATKAVLLAGLTADLHDARRSELRSLAEQARRLQSRPPRP